MKNKKRWGLVLGSVLLVVLVLAFAWIYQANYPSAGKDTGTNQTTATTVAPTGNGTTDAPDTDANTPVYDKTITVKIVYDGISKEVNISTNANYLKGALDEQSLIEGTGEGDMFFITTVDGRVADSGKQEWWCITKGGEMLMTGCSTTPIADGETFELTLTTGW